MAIKPVDNETFYREVDEEVRRDRLQTMWQRYRWLAVGGVVALLALIAGILWWQHEKTARAGAQGETLSLILDDIEAGRSTGIEPRLDALAAEGTPGYRAVALLAKANLALETRDEAKAIAGFKAVAEDGDLPQPFRDAALIRQTALEYDRLPPATVVARLQPLATPGGAWFGSAGEMVAVAHLKQRQPQRAAPIFAALAKDQTIPETIRARAGQMAGALGVDTVQQPAPAAGQAKEAK